EGWPGGEEGGCLHVGGGVGDMIGVCDGERGRHARVGRRGGYGLRHREVGLLGRLGGAGGVVGRVRVELVGSADGRGVGLRGGVRRGERRGGRVWGGGGVRGAIAEPAQGAVVGLQVGGGRAACACAGGSCV